MMEHWKDHEIIKAKEKLWNGICHPGKKGYEGKLEKFMETATELTNQKSFESNFKHRNKTLLYRAVEEENVKIVEYLLKKPDLDVNLGFDGNPANKPIPWRSIVVKKDQGFWCHTTPLYIAVLKNNVQIVELFLKRGDLKFVRGWEETLYGATKSESPLECAYTTFLQKRSKLPRLDMISLLFSFRHLQPNHVKCGYEGNEFSRLIEKIPESVRKLIKVQLMMMYRGEKVRREMKAQVDELRSDYSKIIRFLDLVSKESSVGKEKLLKISQFQRRHQDQERKFSLLEHIFQTQRVQQSFEVQLSDQRINNHIIVTEKEEDDKIEAPGRQTAASRVFNPDYIEKE